MNSVEVRYGKQHFAKYDFVKEITKATDCAGER